MQRANYRGCTQCIVEGHDREIKGSAEKKEKKQLKLRTRLVQGIIHCHGVCKTAG